MPTRRMRRAARLRLDDRRSHLRHVSRARRQALRADRVHAEGDVHQARAHQHMWTPTAKYDEIYTGWSHPPKDYAKWASSRTSGRNTASRKLRACRSRAVVFETWNEANIGYWRGTPEEFRKLHDYAIDGVRRALPTARVGGPDTAGSGGQWMRDFLEHQLRGKNFATGGTARRSISSRFTPRAGRLRRRPRAHGDFESARHDRRRLPDHRRTRS